MRKVFELFVLFFLAAFVGKCQTVSPLTTECAKKCSGSVTIANPGLGPINVTVEPKSFKATSKGDVTLFPLEPGIDVELGARSATIGPQQSHTFFFKVKCATVPCHVHLNLNTSAAQKTTEGLRMVIAFPHTIYVCEKAKDCRVRTLRVEFGYEVAKQ